MGECSFQPSSGFQNECLPAYVCLGTFRRTKCYASIDFSVIVAELRWLGSLIFWHGLSLFFHNSPLLYDRVQNMKKKPTVTGRIVAILGIGGLYVRLCEKPDFPPISIKCLVTPPFLHGIQWSFYERVRERREKWYSMSKLTVFTLEWRYLSILQGFIGHLSRCGAKYQSTEMGPRLLTADEAINLPPIRQAIRARVKNACRRMAPT